MTPRRAAAVALLFLMTSATASATAHAQSPRETARPAPTAPVLPAGRSWRLESWSDAASLATVVQAFLLPVSFLFIVFQLRQQTRLARAGTGQALAELVASFNLELAKDRGLAAYYLKGVPSEKAEDPVAHFQHESLKLWWLQLHENVYYQAEKGLVEAEMFRSYDAALRAGFEHFRLADSWKALHPALPVGFAEHVNAIHSGQAGEASTVLTTKSAAARSLELVAAYWPRLLAGAAAVLLAAWSLHAAYGTNLLGAPDDGLTTVGLLVLLTWVLVPPLAFSVQHGLASDPVQRYRAGEWRVMVTPVWASVLLALLFRLSRF